jgi:arylsulfatase A-like enzyme
VAFVLALLACWAVGTAGVGGTAAAADAARKPNIVLILADDLGVNDLSCYGRDDQPTPNLDRMAAEGIRFTCAYCSQPICSPSRAGLLTGKSPARLHITTFLPGRADAKSQKLLHPKIRQALPLEERTLAEYLKDAGYATACIGKWHLGGADFGPDKQGFDVVHAGKSNTMPSATEGGKGEYDLTAQAVKFIEQHKEGPFFLYLPHNTPHIPLAAKPELVEKHKTAFNPICAAMMETMDDCVGLVLAKIKELGLDEQTIVIFTSDNGGLHVHEFANSPATHNSPFRAGKGFLYEGGLREPLIVRWPGRLKPLVSETPLSHMDLLPTLLALAGLPVPQGLDGIDQSPYWLGKGGTEPAPALRKFIWHFPHYNNQGGRPSGAIRDGDWKLITYYDTGRVELYNLKDDVSESHDLATDHVDRAAELHKLHETWCKEASVQTNTPNPDFDPALFKRLYEDFDPSRPPSALTAAAMEEQMKGWRALMNEVVRGSAGGKKKK